MAQPTQIPLILTLHDQTGDMSHVAGALALSDRVEVLVIAPAGTSTVLLKSLYERAAGAVAGLSRVHIQETSPRAEPGADRKLYSALRSNQEREYTEDLSKSNDARRKYVKELLGDAAYAQFETKFFQVDPVRRTIYIAGAVGTATKIVAQCFTELGRVRAYQILAQRLTYDEKNPDIAAMRAKIVNEGKIGNFQLPPTDRPRILLLWARYTGNKTDTGYNPAGDSDPVGQNQIVECARRAGFEVITIGDETPPSLAQGAPADAAAYHLGEFWTDAVWGGNNPLKGKDRGAQVSFFAALMDRYPGKLFQAGQKTGAMDFPALIGVPTVYIEDTASPSAFRMEQWDKPNTVQVYFRAETSKPPTLIGKAIRKLTAEIRAATGSDEDRFRRLNNGRELTEERWRILAQLWMYRPVNIESAIEKMSVVQAREYVSDRPRRDMVSWQDGIARLTPENLARCKTWRGYKGPDEAPASDLLSIQGTLVMAQEMYEDNENVVVRTGGQYKKRKEL